MKFPKQELNIDEYLDVIKNILLDDSCQIFIDTNIISQLYRLNENARVDLYNWIDSCKDRFHIPNWSVHEYSRCVTSQQTQNYLDELVKAKTLSKELDNIVPFIKGYVGDSLLVGSQYEGKKEQLFKDMDNISKNFSKIANAINKHLKDHQQRVHDEILTKLGNYIMESDIYKILGDLSFEWNLRFDEKIPPGFKDSDKTTNRIGDLLIWKEILDYCEKVKKQSTKEIKAILISRDLKPDMVYRPIIQKLNNHKVKDEDKIEIAHESLAYEFKAVTGSEHFYLISFYTLVKILSSQYSSLAISFQLATEQENMPDEKNGFNDNSILEELEEKRLVINSEDNNINPVLMEKAINQNDQFNNELYSDKAYADSLYDTTQGNSPLDECITNLKSHNWYKQNSAISDLQSMTFSSLHIDQKTKDAIFVLGRNVLQSADGTSAGAMDFLKNLHLRISKWPEDFQQAFIDGCLYEVFFDSYSNIRKQSFKASYFSTVVREVGQLPLKTPFEFINKHLERKKEERFVPVVGSKQVYHFKFSIEIKGDGVSQSIKTVALEVDNVDISETFKERYTSMFSYSTNIESALSLYYAIEVDRIKVTGIPSQVKVIYFINDDNFLL